MTKPLIIITGGTSGIGFEISKTLSQKYELALVYRSNYTKAENAITHLKSISTNKIESFSMEIINDETAISVYRCIQDSFHLKPYALINCAGDTKMSLFLQSNFNDYIQMFQSHVFGVMSLTRIVCEEMYSQKCGRIINFSSIASLGNEPGMTIYGSAKSAIEGFTRALAKEVIHRNIFVNCLQPGVIELPGENLDHYANDLKIAPEKIIAEVIRLLNESCTRTGEIIPLNS